MAQKPTYEELEQRIQKLEQKATKFKQIEEGSKQNQIELDALFPPREKVAALAHTVLSFWVINI